MIRLPSLVTLAILLAYSFGTAPKQSAQQPTDGSPAKENSCQTLQQHTCCKDGKDGKDGRNGKDGRDGLHGKDGRDGRDGTSGAKGEKGESGIQGRDEKGEKGSPGDKGEQGPKGVPGICDTQGKFASSTTASCKTECDVGFHFFEKVQDLPTRGAFGVEHFFINGTLFLAFANYYGDIRKYKTSSMIYKMDESTRRLTLYQTLQPSGAYDIEYFTISNEHFLAEANYYEGSHLKDSIIYKWNGNLFVVVQKIPTKGASHFTFFTRNGNNYIAVTNHEDGSTRSIKSVIYKWSGNQFNKFQEIATEGALGSAVFIMNNNTFIAFANHFNSQKKYSVHSTVLKWSGGHFVKLQSLQTYGAWDVKSFQINGHTFLAFANYYSGSKYNTDSFIFKWNGNKFSLFQSIPTRGARALYPFVISGQTFLGVANHHGDSQKYNTKSVVYQASGSQFVIYQEFPTQGASDITSFEYKGDTYLAVSTYYNGQKYNTNSALYKWM